MDIFTNLGRDISGLFFPNICVLCTAELFSQERHLCSSCIVALPQTNFKKDYNPLDQKLRGRIPYDKVLTMFYFNTDGAVQELLKQVKYRNNSFLAIYLGKLLAQKMEAELNTIDVLIPIPLHKKREDARGYNQSLLIAQGISDELGIPIKNDIVFRTKYTASQTYKSRNERAENMKGAFAWKDKNELKNKKICLIDDVITTGSTIESCILSAPKDLQANFTILSLAAAIES